MIERLVIRGLGIIDEAAIELHPGLTAITGETGAGKTMVLSGFALLTGGKADASLVRKGAAQASVEGEWIIEPDGTAAQRLAEAGADIEFDGSTGRVITVRTVAAEGRSRAVAGGRGVPAGVLADAGEALVAVHGQAEQMRLRSPAAQRELLDRFAGEAGAAALRAFTACFDAWRAAANELRALVEERAVRERESAMLALGIAEVESVAPQPGEDLELDRRAAMLGNLGSLLADVRSAHDALVGGDDDDQPADAVSALARAQQAIDRAASVDPSLGPVAVRIGDLLRALPDLSSELASYAGSIDADPAQQAWVEERRAQLSTLKRRYGASIDEVIEWLESARAMVAEVAGDEGRIAELEEDEARLASEVRQAAATLTEVRRMAAARLSDAVSAELSALAMPDAQIDVVVTSSEDPADIGPHGADAIEIRLRPHIGSDFRPITRGASGGELSRIMLAIEVALAGADPVPTFIFDEVDAGIGGRAAVEVGRRLARLARTAQVIVVTHLPQVAAFADRQVVVAKGRDGAVTTSSTRVVEGRERVEELVRMLSGLDASQAGAAHAEELLAVADEERAAGAGGDGVAGARGAPSRPRVTNSGRRNR